MDDSRFRGVELEQWEDGLINGCAFQTVLRQELLELNSYLLSQTTTGQTAPAEHAHTVQRARRVG